MRVLVGSGVSLILLWSLLAVWSNESGLFPVAGLLGVLALAWVIVLFVWNRRMRSRMSGGISC